MPRMWTILSLSFIGFCVLTIPSKPLFLKMMTLVTSGDGIVRCARGPQPFDVETETERCVTSRAPDGGHESGKASPKQGTLMCAWDQQTLRFAWMQITILRRMAPQQHQHIVVYHAEELTDDQPGVKRLRVSAPRAECL